MNDKERKRIAHDLTIALGAGLAFMGLSLFYQGLSIFVDWTPTQFMVFGVIFIA